MSGKHLLMVITSVQGYCSCGQWGMASDGGLGRLRDLHRQHVRESESAMARKRAAA